MPYNITRYQLTVDPDSRFPLLLEDGILNTNAASIVLTGKNYSGYGQIFNDNFVWLTENFAGTGSPNNPLTGQLWFDTENQTMKVYNHGTWSSITLNTNALLNTGGYFSGSLISSPAVSTNPAITLHQGTAANPSLNFISSSNTGLYLDTLNNFAISIAGSNVITVSNNSSDAALVINSTGAVQIPVGTSSQRPFAPTTGMMRVNTSTGSPEIFLLSTWVDISPPSAGYVVKSGDTMTGDLIMFSGTSTPAQLRLDNGTTAAPSLSFENAPGTGILYGGSNDFIVSHNGSSKWRFNSTGIIPITDVSVKMGTSLLRLESINSNYIFTSPSNSAEPTYTFDSDSGSGLYKDSSSGRLELSYQGAMKLSLGTSATGSDVVVGGTASITLPNGTTGQRPSSPTSGMVRFNSDTSTVEEYNGSKWFSHNPLGIASASVLFNGTTNAIVAAYNVNSVTYGSGAYTINFINAMPDTNYIVIPVVQDNGGSVMIPSVSSTGKTVSAVEILVQDASDTNVQPGFVNVVVFSTS